MVEGLDMFIFWMFETGGAFLCEAFKEVDEILR
jgi:hypothetical protein